MRASSTKTRSLRSKYTLEGFAFLTPAIIYAIFAVYPFFNSLVLSFQDWNGFSARTFTGLDNRTPSTSTNTAMALP